MNKIDKIEIITARNIIEKERKRLIRLKNSKDNSNKVWWNCGLSSWARKQFGDNLTEKDGLTNANGSRINETDCNICGGLIKPDEKVIRLSFNFCDEYECEMNICKKCLINLNKKLEE